MTRRYHLILLIGLLLMLIMPGQGVFAQTPAPVTDRPLVVINGYYLDKDTIAVGDSFNLFVELKNISATQDASNLILSFINDSFLPQETGGVVALGMLAAGGDRTVTQRFLVSSSLAGQPVGTIPLNLSYTGPDGTQYSERFTITLQLRIYYRAAFTPTPSPTPTLAPVVRPQLVVSSYRTDVNPLQPGSLFKLSLDVRNLGNADARSVTMVLGGGVAPDPGGTPQPGGVSGAGGDLSVFAPVGASNLVFLGDVPAGASLSTTSDLVVNVSANPGAYTLKISFVYTDPKGLRLVDDQIITLLIYRLPVLEVNFYRDPGPLFSGQPNILPIQVVNLGKATVVLGNMTVSAEGAELQNNTVLVGALDPGGFYTLDTTFTPMQAGEMTIKVVLNYTDDFNQPRQVEQIIPVVVQEGAPVIEPGMPSGEGEIPVQPVQETFWQKVLRFIRGLLGLDSAPPQPVVPEGEVPVQEFESVPVPPLKGP